jgi:hypothetical protein
MLSVVLLCHFASNTECHYAEHFAECNYVMHSVVTLCRFAHCCIVLLSMVMLSVIILSVFILSFSKLSIVMLGRYAECPCAVLKFWVSLLLSGLTPIVIMLSISMLNVVMLSFC